MNLFEMFRPNRSTLLEGGNIAIGQHQAQQINLQVTNRGYIVPILNKLLADISKAYSAQFKEPLWDPKLLKSQEFLSGSSLHFFNVKGIPDATFVAKKPKVGDIDTMVAKEKEGNLEQFLTDVTNQQIGGATLLGFQRGNEQFSSLWELQDPPIKVQIDLEFVGFEKGTPTAWSRFSHSSSWDDIQSGVKGVFHKFLIQSFAVLTKKEFLLRKQVGRGKARTWQDVPTEDSMLSFAVSSKEGGGLRAKYTPVTNPQTGEPEVIDGLPVMMALPAAGYEQDIGKIFQSIFGIKMNEKAAEKLADKFWSFTGLLDVMNKLLDQDEKNRILGSFLNKTYGPGAQGLYKNDPERDAAEKNAAIDLLMSKTGAQPPEGMNLDQMRQEYTSSYKMTAEDLEEADDITAPPKPNYARQGIKHLFNRLPDGRISSMEMSNTEFKEVAQEIADNGGTLNGMPVNLKVDGAGIRFGKDESGRPFMMTSKVTTPLYADNVGYFTDFGREKGQDAETLARTKKYDDALALITGSKFIQTLPDNTIVQAEMLYTPMAQETDQGLKFVNISYDPKKLGREMTLVPFMVKEYSTGEKRPDADKILQRLSAASDRNIKIVSNRLEQKGIDVSKIIQPVLDLDPKSKENKPAFDQAKQELSDAIISSPKLRGANALGSNMEGIVVNLPNGKIFKVTSQQMKGIMAAKSAPAEKSQGVGKTAVVAIGSFVGHVGHEQLWNYTLEKAKAVGGDPYLFIGTAVGADDPIPPSVKVQTWHKMYPEYAKNISTVTQEGGTLMQKIKHELINPQPGQPPKYDNIIIMVGEDQAKMNIANALMKAVNKFPGYENVKVTLEPTPRGTGMSFTRLRNVLKDPNATPEQQYALWSQGFDEKKLGRNWILHLMDVTRKGMGITQKQAEPVAETRLFNALIRPGVIRKEEAGVGVIASKKQAKDPRYSTSLTKDVRPGQIEKSLKAFKLAEKDKDMEENDNMSGTYTVKKPGLGFQTYATNHIAPGAPREGMLPTSAFAGTGAPTYHKLGPAAQAKGKQKEPVKRGQLVGEDDLDQEEVDENLRQWFKDKWVRFGPDGKIRGDCARGDDSEGKPKCLPQSKAHSLGKKGRASAASRKRREDPNPERKGAAINVATKKKTNEQQLDEKCWDTHKQIGMKKKGNKMVPNCVPKENTEKCPECGGPMFSELLIKEKKDACYYKVKSRYKVWPSAYASGALVKCRKKGAKNWGSKSESTNKGIPLDETAETIISKLIDRIVVNEAIQSNNRKSR